MIPFSDVGGGVMNTKVTGVAAYLQTVVRSEKPRGVEYRVERNLGYVAYA